MARSPKSAALGPDRISGVRSPGPTSLPNRSSLIRSVAVTVIRLGSLPRRISFSTLRYWACWASTSQVSRAIG